MKATIDAMTARQAESELEAMDLNVLLDRAVDEKLSMAQAADAAKSMIEKQQQTLVEQERILGHQRSSLEDNKAQLAERCTEVRQLSSVNNELRKGGRIVAGPKKLMVAIADYAPSPNAMLLRPPERELAFQEGDLISVFGNERSDGLYDAEVHDVRGRVPAALVRPAMAGRSSSQNGTALLSAYHGKHPGSGKYMRGRIAYEAGAFGGNTVSADRQLSFAKGELLFVNYGASGGADGMIMAEKYDKTRMGYVPFDMLDSVEESVLPGRRASRIVSAAFDATKSEGSLPADANNVDVWHHQISPAPPDWDHRVSPSTSVMLPDSLDGRLKNKVTLLPADNDTNIKDMHELWESRLTKIEKFGTQHGGSTTLRLG